MLIRRDTVDSQTASEKSRVAKLQKQLDASNETLERCEMDLKSHQERSNVLSQEKSNLLSTKRKIENDLTSAKESLVASKNQLREIDSERRRLK